MTELAPPGAEPSALRRTGGEFRAAALEAIFAAEGAAENHGQARVLLIASVILNSLFFLSDWRFAGTPHFWVAIPARAVVVAGAALALILLGRRPDAARRRQVLGGWMVVNALGVAALVSSRSDIALFVVMMLPLIYYLAVPVPFRWTLAGGAGCSMLLLLSYESGNAGPTSLGLTLAMLVLNVALVIVVTRSNRLERLAWLAARAERRTSAALAAARAESEKIFVASPVPKVLTRRSDGKIVRYNDSALEFFGGTGDALGGAFASDFYVDIEDRDQLLALIERDGEVRDFETDVRRFDGEVRTVLVKATTLDLAGGPMILSGFIDISDRKAAEKDLEWLAKTDMLTGLPNRFSFFATARAEMMRAARAGTPLALLMIDIDQFKQVNDGFGHAGGDEALRVFAGCCRTLLGDRGIAARLGGEEFAILLPGAGRNAAVAFAETLRQAIADMPIELRRGTLRLTASIGVSLIDPRERELDAAMARADQALYEAKNGGRNRVVAAGGEGVRRAV